MGAPSDNRSSVKFRSTRVRLVSSLRVAIQLLVVIIIQLTLPSVVTTHKLVVDIGTIGEFFNLQVNVLYTGASLRKFGVA